MFDRKQLEKLIEEAIVDCYDEGEQRAGFHAMLENRLQFPFPAKVIGETVSVTGVLLSNGGIRAICKRKDKKHFIDILDIGFNAGEVKGCEWIDAYRQWSKYS